MARVLQHPHRSSLLGLLMLFFGCSSSSDGIENPLGGPMPPVGPDSVTVTIEKAGDGMFVIEPLGVTCDEDCTERSVSVERGSELVLRAIPSCGHELQTWSGDCAGSSRELELGADSDRRCVARFEATGATSIHLGTAPIEAEVRLHDTWGATLSSVVVAPDGSPSVSFDLAAGPLWRLEHWSPSETVRTEPDAASRFRCRLDSPDDSSIELVWNDVVGPGTDAYDVTVRARMDAGPRAELSFESEILHTQAGAGTHGIGRFDVPLLHLEDRGPSSEAYLGAMGGMRFRDPVDSLLSAPESSLDLAYPGLQNLRFDAYADVDRGAALLLTVDDEEPARWAHKQFLAASRPAREGSSRNVLTLAIGRMPVEPFTPHDVFIDGETVIAAARCRSACWYDVAARYRQQIEAEGFLTRPRLSDLPASTPMAQQALVTLLQTWNPVGEPDFQDYLDYLADLTQWFHLEPHRIVSLWYEWQQGSSTGGFPDYFPTRSNFAEKILAASDAGYGPILPYTIPGVWNADLPSFTAKQVAERAAVIQRQGELSDAFRGHVDLDLAAALTRDHFANQVIQPLVADYGATGSYLDAFPLFFPCYGDQHGHALGGGDSFARGARSLVDRVIDIQQEHGLSPYVLTEGAREYLIDRLSLGFIQRNANYWRLPTHTELRAGRLPLLDIVYHHYLPLTGVLTHDYYPGLPADPTVQAALTQLHVMELGWSFVVGQVPVMVRRTRDPAGEVAPTIFDHPEFRVTGELAVAITQLRTHPRLREFLMLGELAAPPRQEQIATTELAVPEFVVPLAGEAIPNVWAGAFRDRDGNVAIAAINWTKTIQDGWLVVDPEAYDMGQTATGLADTWRMSRHDAAGQTVLTEDLGADMAMLHIRADGLLPRVPVVYLLERR